ncbi:hypothetical protein BJX76DRAFT_204460 [Aspergillus varians]
MMATANSSTMNQEPQARTGEHSLKLVVHAVINLGLSTLEPQTSTDTQTVTNLIPFKFSKVRGLQEQANSLALRDISITSQLPLEIYTKLKSIMSAISEISCHHLRSAMTGTKMSVQSSPTTFSLSQKACQSSCAMKRHSQSQFCAWLAKTADHNLWIPIPG